MRCFVVASFLTLACLSAGQDTSVHVTYNTRAARASQIVKELGALAKVDLEVSAQTENEVLVISASDVPLSALMARIASVTSGEWKQEGTVYRLVGSTIVRNQEERDEFSKRVTAIRKAIQSRIKEEETFQQAVAKAEAKEKAAAKADVKGKKKTGEEATEEEDAVEETQASSPEEMAITGLIKELDPAVLAQIESGDRLVFSTEPTRTQRNLGAGATEIINEFITKHDSAIGATQPDMTDQFAGLSEEQAESFRQMMKRQMSKIGQAAKALLIASTSPLGAFGMSQAIQLELRIYDHKGIVVFTGDSSLQVDGNDFMAEIRQRAQAAAEAAASGKAGEPPTKTAEPETKQTPIELSEDSKALQQATSGMTVGKFSVQFNQELHQKLFAPTKYDPLSFMDTDEVLFYAKSKGRPLVADIPDKAFSGFTIFGGAKTKSLEAYAKDLQKGGPMVLVPDDSFIVIKPSAPATARADRLDRSALATLLNATAEKGVPSLDDMCAYAAAAPNPMFGGVAQLYVMLFVPGAMSTGLDGTTSWDMLRFYGQLPSEARSSLGAGGRVAISSLTPGQHGLLERMTYGAEAQLSVDDGKHKSDDDSPAWMRMSGMGGGSDYKSEPTEIVPNGLPADGYLDLKGTSEPFATPIGTADSAPMAMLGVLGPDELALFKMMRTMQGAEQFSAMLPKFPKLHIGERSVLNFTFHLAPQVTMKQTLKDHHMGKDAGVYSEDNLPADLQRRVAERAEALKKSPLGAMGSFMGGGQAIKP
jgi:hypothetical protein